MPQDNSRIAILTSVASYILTQSRNIFTAGAGFSPHELPSDVTLPGLIDEIDPNTELWNWANAVLGLMRYTAAILSRAMLEDEDLMIEEDYEI